jgi:V/A-type H+/Na+-transporting ATPase subunit D
MQQQVFPTKGNLMSTKKSLELAVTGFDLLDKKRNILVREMMSLIEKATKIQENIDSVYNEAYLSLQKANITLGICDELAKTVPIENGISLKSKSIMGVEIPIVKLDANPIILNFSFSDTNSLLDEAYLKFDEVKRLTAELAETENSIYRLAHAIKKTQKRANALKNIMIPRFKENIKFITDVLAEKEREDFSRQKIIKKQKENKKNRVLQPND